MRSAETSGAGATRFGAGKGQAARGRTETKARNGAPRRTLSPVTVAVAFTGMLSALLFVVYDTVRTFADTPRDLSQIGTTLLSDFTRLDPEAAFAPILNPTHRLNALSGDALVLPAAASASAGPEAGPTDQHELLALQDTQTAAIAGIAQRGAGAFGLAGLLTLLVWRRQKPEAPDLLQRQSYRTLASAIPLGVACWTRTGDLVVCNDKYRESLQLSGATVTYHDAVRRLIVGGYMKLLKEDDDNRLLELHREDGSCLLIDERPLGDGGFMTLVSDVTEARKTDTLLNAIREEQRLLARRYHEEKLKAEAASRSKTNFLAHLSHDIRTPLNHIIGFAELMRHQTYGPLGDPRYAEYVQSIKTSGEHLLASFATILDLAELESGQKALRSDPVPIDDLLHGVVQRFRGQAARAGVTFIVGESCGAVVMGDRLGLGRMVANIVENSLRFTPAGGRLTLAAFAAPDGVVIEITDTGIGMSEERLASLSQPFALGDATFTRDGVGPGLGISISRAIAELSGGNLAIDSTPTLGTTVAISLPIRHEMAREAAE